MMIEFWHIDNAQKGIFLKYLPFSRSENLMAIQSSDQ